jgi:hypothetical protein
MKRLGIAALVAVASAPSAAHAFCGFYIDPGGSEMFNNATQVVLMRQGTRTVLSMQNNYQGPPGDFALVVPVPVVLAESDVKTLPKSVFAKVDGMSSPRLVEYWEQDPCFVEPPREEIAYRRMSKSNGAPMAYKKSPDDYGVTVEAKFDVGEYQISILSAKDSTGLERYLRDQKYKIPKGAEPLLRPYVVGGSKFFVAKVNPAKVRFENGQAMLSPLRFHYDSDEFSLPIRLGLANSSGTQDLIVNILSNTRYELANYKNVTIPTNFDVKDEVRTRFGEFYAALFDRTVQQNPGAIVTEYSWDASSCDPCPGPRLDGTDFMTLGADVATRDDAQPTPNPNAGRGRRMYRGSFGLVLTRLHARYGKDGVPNDLVFKTATPIVGGREHRNSLGELEHGAEASGMNNFQGRYAIRHEWTGPIACENPVRGRWGGPPPGAGIATPRPTAATNIAFAPRGNVQLPNLVVKDIPEIAVQQGVPFPPAPAAAVAKQPSPLPSGAGFQSKPQGCGCNTGNSSTGIVLGGVLLLVLRRRPLRKM